MYLNCHEEVHNKRVWSTKLHVTVFLDCNTTVAPKKDLKCIRSMLRISENQRNGSMAIIWLSWKLCKSILQQCSLWHCGVALIRLDSQTRKPNCCQHKPCSVQLCLFVRPMYQTNHKEKKETFPKWLAHLAAFSVLRCATHAPSLYMYISMCYLTVLVPPQGAGIHKPVIWPLHRSMPHKCRNYHPLTNHIPDSPHCLLPWVSQYKYYSCSFTCQFNFLGEIQD